MENFKKINQLTGWIVFAIATAVYFLTLEPTASWWDCGEYIATAYKLQVGHPPGAPLFQLLGRFFSLFAFGNLENVALMINIMSALSSSFTILFLFWTITLLAKKIIVSSKNGILTVAEGLSVIGAGVVGALAYAFSDSFWFSASEGEVYAMSSLFTAIVFWAILKWEEVADKRAGFRWLLLIAYVMGLSIGVHLLNLLAIPAIVYVYYYKKYTYSHKGFLIAGLISLIILVVIMYMIIPGIVEFAGKFELFFVNSIGMPFNSGTILYFLLLTGLIVWGLFYTYKKRKTVWNTVILAVLFLLIGYSSFFILIIRANANTPINENDPNDAISLLSYLNREQYGTWPIFYGQYYNAPIVDHADGNPVYMKDEKKGTYIIKDDRKGTVPVYDERFMTIFPRMWSNTKPGHITLYEHFGDVEGRPISVADGKGGTKVLYRPTFGENLKYFFRYQFNFMYLRYFMWNFAGRQNNIESQGELNHGNWISGINFIDSMRLGDQSNLPSSMENPAKTKFYFLPLILGLIGFFFQLGKSKGDTWVVALLFIMTGLAIIVYLNQTPLQPRERDYAYAGSFYAFAIWIGLGVLGLYNALQKKMGNKVMAAAIVSVASLVLVPGIMAEQGWDSHDRSGKYAAVDFAKMYLDSCEPNSILFTNGDNDTFPLWYVQEVEDYRTDIRVVNYMLSSGDWYVSQMGRKVYDSERLPLTIDQDFYKKKAGYVPVFERVEEAELIDAIKFINDDNKGSRVPLQDGSWIDYLPAKKLKYTVDKEAAIASGTVPIEDSAKIVDVMEWPVRQNGLFRNDLMILDLIATNNWERPIYFANPNSHAKVLGVDKYCHLEGVVYRFRPTIATNFMSKIGGVNADRTYEVIMDDKVRWGRLNQDDVVVDRESDRNSGMAKQNYVRLAQSLLMEKKYDSVVKVLDRGIELFPHKKFPFDYFMISWADFYYQSGEIDKANELVKTIAERYEEDLSYYTSRNDRFAAEYQEEIQESMAVMQRLVQLTSQNKQEELSKELEESFYAQISSLKMQ
jgi:tetratricopeptide (TPR) repeat protein